MIEPGKTAKILKTNKYYPFEIGDEVTVFRKAVDGYKVSRPGKVLGDPDFAWWYVEESDIEEIDAQIA